MNMNLNLFKTKHKEHLVLLAATAILCSGSIADEYRNRLRGCAFKIPDGWVEFSEERRALTNELGRRVNVAFTTGFQPKGQGLAGYPYVLFEFKKMSMDGVNYENLEKWFAKAAPGGLREAKGALADIAKDLSLDAAIFDRNRDRIVMGTGMVLEDGRKIKGISYGMISGEGIIWLHSYAHDDEFDRYLPIFNQMADSFRYDPGYEFVPGRTSGRGPPEWLVSTGPIIGVFVGVLIGTILAMRAMKQKRASKADGAAKIASD
jgi:hypothetical protein